MKVISLGSGKKIFEENSDVRKRQADYGRIFEELHIIVFTSRKDNYEEQKIASNVFLYPTNTKFRGFYIFDYIKIFKKIYSKTGREKVVLSVQDPFETGLAGLWLKSKYKLPLQVQLHTDFANKYFIFHSFLNILRFPIAEIVLSFADSVRVVSQRIAKSVHNLPEHISVLPINVPKVTEVKRGEKLNFLTVSRLEPEKDIPTLIYAFQKVVQKNSLKFPDLSLTIAGEGSEKAKLQNLAKRLGLKDRIKFLGWQTSNLSSLYENACAYVSTSLYEGYGMSMVEAALHGLPLIISNAGVAGEIFHDKKEALIFKPKDEEALVSAMDLMLSYPEMRKNIGNAAQEAAKKSVISQEEYLSRYENSMQLALDSFAEGKNIFKRNILLRYLVAGITGAGTQIGLLFVFTSLLKIWYLYSAVLSFIVAVAISFTLQKFWTFADSSTKKMHHQFARYMAVALLGLLANTGILYIFVEAFRLNYLLGQVVTSAFIAALNFFLYKLFIFQKK